VISYTYEAAVGGKVAAVGGRLLGGASRVIIGQFFAALARKAGGGSSEPGLIARLLALLGPGLIARLQALLGLRK
jgi:2-furoyl-CoA dehydrogenase large subunit